MKNIKLSMKGKDTLVIECNLKEKGEPSASGKTLLIAATTGGASAVGLEGCPPGLKLNMSLYVPNPDRVR